MGIVGLDDGRCVPGALIGGQGRAFEACARDFKAVAALPEDADAQKAAAVLHRGWSCVMRAFTQPIEQLVAQAQAVGECRPAVPVKNTSGKGAWPSVAGFLQDGLRVAAKVLNCEPEEEADPVSDVSARCQQCQAPATPRLGRFGRGAYADCLYCSECWKTWRS
ncbi:unnamed protein product [Effrenium voratum]|nr:unnamed protein product [Effrenium voratum]